MLYIFIQLYLFPDKRFANVIEFTNYLKNRKPGSCYAIVTMKKILGAKTLDQKMKITII